MIGAGGCGSGSGATPQLDPAEVTQAGEFIVPADLTAAYQAIAGTDGVLPGAAPWTADQLIAELYYEANHGNIYTPITEFNFHLAVAPQGAGDAEIQALADELGLSVSSYWWRDSGTYVTLRSPQAVSPQLAMAIYGRICERLAPALDWVDGLVGDLNLPG